MENDIQQSDPPLHFCGMCNRSFKTNPALLSHQRYCKVDRPASLGMSLDTNDLSNIPKLPETATRYDEYDDLAEIPNSVASVSAVPQVLIRKLSHYRDLPDIKRATAGSAGYDLYAAIDFPLPIGVGDRIQVPTGLCLELPPNMVAKVVPRSGLALRHGLSLLNTPGIIDSDYRGEIIAIVVNHSTSRFWVEPGTRIAQMLFEWVVHPSIVYVDNLSDTERAGGGFGSTGKF